MRIAGTILVLTLSAVAAWFLVWTPAHCNATERAAKQTIYELYDRPVTPMKSAVVARTVMARIEPCLRRCPNENLYMISAAAARLLGRPQDALAAYRKALEYGRRPEIYLNVGLMEAETGHPDEAVATMTTACKFAPYLIESIDDGILQARVRNNVVEYRRSLFGSPGARQ